MSDRPFKTVSCAWQGKEYEIRVYKTHQGYEVYTYSGEVPAFNKGYICDYESDERYKQQFGQHGWQRLLSCARADITGRPVYRTNRKYTPTLPPPQAAQDQGATEAAMPE